MISSPVTFETGLDRKFWIVFEQAAVGMALIAPDGRYLRANPELRRLLGYTEQQLRALTIYDTSYLDDRSPGADLAGKLLTGEIGTYRMENRFARRDGRLVWAQLSVSVVRDEADKAVHFIVVVQDITTQKRAVEEMEQARTRYHAICDTIDSFVAVTDLRGTLVFTNEASARLLGSSPSTLIGTNIYRYIHPDDHEAVQEEYRKFASGKSPRPKIKFRMLRRDGSPVWVESALRAFSSGRGHEREVVFVTQPAREAQDLTHTPAIPQVPAIRQSREMAEHCMPPEEMDQRDEATGLRNRVSIEGLLSAHLANRRSSSFPFGCLLVEVDYFEDIEEEYGPGVGAEVLKRVGEILAESCRVEDYVAHYTRDQFLVVLPTTNASGTIILGEKLLRNVRNEEYADVAAGRPMTISVGATCVFHGTTLDLAGLMDVLEQQLEQARRTGHNRLVMNTRQTLEHLGRY